MAINEIIDDCEKCGREEMDGFTIQIIYCIISDGINAVLLPKLDGLLAAKIQVKKRDLILFWLDVLLACLDDIIQRRHCEKKHRRECCHQRRTKECERRQLVAQSLLEMFMAEKNVYRISFIILKIISKKCSIFFSRKKRRGENEYGC